MFTTTSSIKLLEKNRDLAEMKKAYETEQKHQKEIEELKEKHRIVTKDLKDNISIQDSQLQKANDEKQLLLDRLAYEEKQRQILIDAVVQKELGQYETKYFHDLHTQLEKRSDGMQAFLESAFEKILNAVKDSKPVMGESKVMILGKEVFDVGQKAGGGEKKGGGGEKA